MCRLQRRRLRFSEAAGHGGAEGRRLDRCAVCRLKPEQETSHPKLLSRLEPDGPPSIPEGSCNYYVVAFTSPTAGGTLLPEREETR